MIRNRSVQLGGTLRLNNMAVFYRLDRHGDKANRSEGLPSEL